MSIHKRSFCAWLAPLVILAASTTCVVAQTILFVDDDAAQNGDGLGWPTAYRYLQDALAVASANPGQTTEIRVAQGTYRPDQGQAQLPGDRTSTFQLIDTVILKGGYGGLGAVDPNRRDLRVYETVLEGAGVYHVATCTGVGNKVVLDGVAIQGGHADGADDLGRGGGLLIVNASPRVRNCFLRANYASDRGGAVHNDSGSSPCFANCLFSGNLANYGAAMSNANASSPLLINCAIAGNTAINTTGGVWSSQDSIPRIYNCILWYNSDNQGFWHESSQFWAPGTLELSNSYVQGLMTSDHGNIGGNGEDPYFVNAFGLDGTPGTADDDFRLDPTSPCIDRGDNVALPPDVSDLDGDGDTTEPLPLDRDGQSRVFNCFVDMGAYESQVPRLSPIGADADGDCDLDAADLQQMEACGSGPAVPIDNPSCASFDQDLDNDVDQDDFAVFQRCQSGSGVPAAANCFPQNAYITVGDPQGHTRVSFNPILQGVFDRPTAEPLFIGKVKQVFDAHTPRTRAELVVSAPDLTIFTGPEPGAYGRIEPHCRTNNYLIGYDRNVEQVYRSADGTNWNMVGTPFTVYSYMVRGNGDRIITIRSDHGVQYPYWSDDSGATWMRGRWATDGTFMGSVSGEWWVTGPWSLTHRGDTVVVAFWNGITKKKQLLTSHDNGETWIKAIDLPASTFHHFHAVGYHQGTGKWLVNTGDGVNNRKLFTSTDDGDTWANWQGNDDHPISQTVRWLDYGHPTRILFASDVGNYCGWLDLVTNDIGPLVDWWPTADIAYGWEIFEHDGLYYFCSNNYGASAGQHQAEITVSKDLERIGRYCRLPSDYSGVTTFAGYFGGKLHLILEKKDTTKWHATLSPAKVRTATGAILNPASYNVVPANEADCNSRGSLSLPFEDWMWPNYYEFVPDPEDPANNVLHLVKNQPTTYSRVTKKYPTVPGATYIASVRAKGYCRSATLVFGAVNSGEYPIGPDRWTRLRTVFTATSSSTSFSVNFYPVATRTPLMEVWLDGLSVQVSPLTEWVAGGASSGADSLYFVHDLPPDFTNVVTAVITPGSRSSFGHGYLATWTTDNHYVGVYWDGETRQWKIEDDQHILSAGSTMWFNPGSQVRIALRHSAGVCTLSVVCGDHVEHLAPINTADLSGPNRTILAGDQGGSSLLPHTLIDSVLYNYAMTDQELEAVLAGAY